MTRTSDGKIAFSPRALGIILGAMIAAAVGAAAGGARYAVASAPPADPHFEQYAATNARQDAELVALRGQITQMSADLTARLDRFENKLDRLLPRP